MQTTRLFLCPGSTWTCLLLFFTACPSICLSVMIRQQPVNVTVLEGSDSKFHCDVIEQRTVDLVFWKKVTKDDFASVLTYNEKSTNGTKYSVDSHYTLTIRHVTVDDEAWYECQAGEDRSRAMLTVNVMMTNMTLTWQDEPPFSSQTMANLTCLVIHSRPPADITWFHGVNEMTGLGSTCKQTSDLDGFGDSTSTVTVLVGVADDVQPYQCVATLPNSGAKRTEITFATMAHGYTSTAGNNKKIYHSLVWSLIILYQILQ